MASMKTCAECRRPIRATETHCFQHGGLSAAELDSIGGGFVAGTTKFLRDMREARTVAKRTREWKVAAAAPRLHVSLAPASLAAEAYVRHTPVAHDAAEAVIDSITSVIGKANMQIPREAASHKNAVGEIAERIAEKIGNDRVTLVEVAGLTRKTARRARIQNPDISHRVIMIDRGTDSEVIVDPFVAAFAPVNRDKAGMPVNGSGLAGVSKSPYGDAPWIGPRDEYLRHNGHISWAKARAVAN